MLINKKTFFDCCQGRFFYTNGDSFKKFTTHSQQNSIDSLYFESSRQGWNLTYSKELSGGNMMNKTKWLV